VARPQSHRLPDLPVVQASEELEADNLLFPFWQGTQRGQEATQLLVPLRLRLDRRGIVWPVGHCLEWHVRPATAIVPRQLVAGDAKQPPAKGCRRAKLIQTGQCPLKGGRRQILSQRLVVHPQAHKVKDAGQVFTIAASKLVSDGGLLMPTLIKMLWNVKYYNPAPDSLP